MADEEPQRLSLDFATSLRGEASVKIDAVIISTAAATEVGLRDLDDTTLFRIKEGDEGAVPGPLRD